MVLTVVVDILILTIIRLFKRFIIVFSSCKERMAHMGYTGKLNVYGCGQPAQIC